MMLLAIEDGLVVGTAAAQACFLKAQRHTRVPALEIAKQRAARVDIDAISAILLAPNALRTASLLRYTGAKFEGAGVRVGGIKSEGSSTDPGSKKRDG